jgi:hypothetical protein
MAACVAELERRWDEEGETLGVKDFCMAMLLEGEADGDADGDVDGDVDGQVVGEVDGHADEEGDGHVVGEVDGHADGDSVTVGVTVTVTIIIIAEEGMADMAAADDDGDAIIDMEAEDDALFLPRPWRKAAGISPPLYSAAMAEPAKAATDRVNKFWTYIVK